MPEKIYIDGLFVKAPNDKAPEWVIAKCSIHADKMIDFLKHYTNAKGYINFDIKKGKSGFYAELNTWQPQEKVMKENEDITLEQNNSMLSQDGLLIDMPEDYEEITTNIPF